MKKIFQFAAMFLAFAAPIVTFTACDDDGDDDSNSENSSSTPSTFLTSIYSKSQGYIYEFEYDDDGYLTKYNENVVSYNPLKIELSDGDVYYDFNTNNGYITGFAATDEDGETTYTCTMTYDSNNHLTKITGKGSYTSGKNSKTETSSTVITWNSNNCITKIVCTTENEGTDGTIDYGYTFKTTTTYSYNEAYLNRTKQYPYGIAPYLQNGYCSTPDLAPLSCVGLLGIGPDYLPDEQTYSYYNYNYQNTTEREDENEFTDNFSYTFNSNGTINYAGGYYHLYDGDTY